MHTQSVECLCKMSECSKQTFNWELLIGSLVVVLGWFIFHYFSQKRDSKNKRKQVVLDFLIASYRTLTIDISDRSLDNQETQYKFETLLADIQLFGSLTQVELARTIAIEMRNKNIANLDMLIIDLRENLRKELNLEKVRGYTEYMRFRNKNNNL